MALRIAIDANALVAALTKRDGSAARIVRAWRDGELEVVASPATIGEAEMVLGGRWLARVAGPDAVAELLDDLRTRAILVDVGRIADLSLKDDGDLRLVEAAVSGGADYLVTADREVLGKRGYAGTLFVTAGEFLRRSSLADAD